MISIVPIGEGQARRLPIPAPSYFHGWSPDGKSLTHTANRGRGFEVFAAEVAGDPAERALATARGGSDSPSYSGDGRWVYFNSDRSGTVGIWRVAATGPGRVERVLVDDRENWNPRPSPDGKWLVYLSYPGGTKGHPPDRDATIRRISMPGATVAPAPAPKPEDLARVVGGHGSIGSRPWSPDSRRFAYVTYEPPPPTIRVVLFTPSDIDPPAGAGARLTKVADAAEAFLFDGLKARGYPSTSKGLFRRLADGNVEVLRVRGDLPASSGKYAKPDYAREVIDRATRLGSVAGEGHVWWIFIDVGDRPTRFNDWRGTGNSRDGGWAMVNYDTIPGEIRPDLGLQVGFNAEFALKGAIHELGHALGLPHDGPDPALGLGNSLMGPNNSVYAERKLTKADQVYLSPASAARLFKHPIVSGDTRDRATQPASVKLLDYKARYSRADDRLTITGKLVADRPAHSVVVADDRGQPSDDYWHRGYAARIRPDGTFEVAIAGPAKSEGHLRIAFCFDNGMVLGDGPGAAPDGPGEFRKSYRFRDGEFRFGD